MQATKADHGVQSSKLAMLVQSTLAQSMARINHIEQHCQNGNLRSHYLHSLLVGMKARIVA